MADEQTQVGQTLSTSVVADLVQRSEKWVQLRTNEGFIKKEKLNTYRPVNVIRGVMAYYEHLLEKSNKAAAANRATDARTREINLRVAMRERDLIPTEDSVAIMADLMQMTKAKFSGWPASYTRDMKTRRKIERDFDKIFADLADEARKRSQALRLGEFALPTDEENNAGSVGSD